jgi:predicted GNAT superfamily acetyltransferase
VYGLLSQDDRARSGKGDFAVMATSINLVEPSQALKAMRGLWQTLKAELIAGNKQVVTLTSFEESMTAQQRKYYHSYILVNIAQQAAVAGRKYAMPVWKEHYRAMFLGDKVVDVTDIKTGVIKRELQRVSSESLSVKGYNELIEQVTADASTEFGVVFDASFEEWQEHE